MSKTKPDYRKTIFGILPIEEIEILITDGVANTNVFLLREFKNMSIGVETAKELHKKVASHVFENAGEFRKNNVTVGQYTPPNFFEVSAMMIDWESDYNERYRHAKSKQEKIELLAWMMHRFLVIHPFFDYNGRVSRLLGQLFLLKNGLPVSSFIGLSRKDFVNAVKSATETKNLDALIGLIEKKL